MDVEYPQRHRQSAPTIDDRDEIGVSWIIVGKTVAIVSVAACQQIRQGSRTILRIGGEPGLLARVFGDLREMRHVGFEIAACMI